MASISELMLFIFKHACYNKKNTDFIRKKGVIKNE